MKHVLDLKPGPERILRFADILDSQLPESFHWDFSIFFTSRGEGTWDAAISYPGSIVPNHCKTVGCAYGLATYLWPDYVSRDLSIPLISMSLFLGIDCKSASRIFRPAECSSARVTPQMVAKALRDYVATGCDKPDYPK